MGRIDRSHGVKHSTTFSEKTAMYKSLALLLLAAFVGITVGPVHADADLSISQNIPHPQASGVPWSPHDIRLLDKQIDALMASAPTLRGAHVGLLAVDTVRGTTLYSRNANDAFQPASNFKLLVGSASLEKLGTSFSFETQALATGEIADGTLTGDLYLRGGGDAHLTAKDLDAAAAAVAAAGITRITGAVIGDATRYDDRRIPEGWDWDDFPFYYAPPISALDLEENIVHAYMTPGNMVGAPVTLRVYPTTTAFTIDNRLTTGPTGSSDTSDNTRPWDHPRTILLTGTLPLGAKESGDIEAAVPDPAEYAVDVFTKALVAHGITIVGGEQTGGMTPSGAQVIWTHNSEPMPQLMADFWWPSDNLMGELFLKELSVASGSTPGSDVGGAAFERKWLASIGVNPDTISISDGSGLSNYDRITPAAWVAILQHDWRSPDRQIILGALPVSGVVGTLRHSFLGTPAEKTVWAKTGSISHVRTITGFIRTRRHGAVSFSFLVDDWNEGVPGAAAGLAKLRGAVLSTFVTN
jgi:D-alanyl-D-alanine carboxypeptidase/D-alanyl-D-alanine-endopeptidase (penicillin-binding protein 4)